MARNISSSKTISAAVSLVFICLPSTKNLFYNKMMHFCACAITNKNECSLFDWFKSQQSPKIVLTGVQKCMFFKIFREAAPDPARGAYSAPPEPSWFSLGPPHSFLPCDGPGPAKDLEKCSLITIISPSASVVQLTIRLRKTPFGNAPARVLAFFFPVFRAQEVDI